MDINGSLSIDGIFRQAIADGNMAIIWSMSCRYRTSDRNLIYSIEVGSPLFYQLVRYTTYYPLPAIACCRYGRLAMLRYIIDRSPIDVCFCMYEAIEHGQLHVVKFLAPRISKHDMCRCLEAIFMADEGNFHVLKYLVAHGYGQSIRLVAEKHIQPGVDLYLSKSAD